jgi:hypothetical protein
MSGQPRVQSPPGPRPSVAQPAQHAVRTPLPDETAVLARLQAEGATLGDVELASEIEFVHNVRATKDTTGRRTKVRLDDRDFAGGTIRVYPKLRMVTIYNPTPDDMTREPITDRIPFENVAHYEVLTAKQAFHYYATAEERKTRAEAQEKRAREIAAAEAKARAEVMAKEAQS